MINNEQEIYNLAVNDFYKYMSKVDIKENECEDIKCKIFALPHEWVAKYIKSLDISESDIRNINPSWDTGSIHVLNMYRCNLEYIPRHWVINDNLRELKLSCNLITDIPSEFNPNNILELDLSVNDIKYIPYNWNPGKIKVLNLSYNNIFSISDYWDPMNIEKLILTGNPIKYLPQHLEDIMVY